MSLAFNITEIRPTPGQRNTNADAMRAVPQFEPRTIVGNAASPWERLATEIGGNGYAGACADPSDPAFYQPQHIAEFGGDYATLQYEGAPVSDTHYRMVRSKGTPAFLRGTMQGFLGSLGDGDADTSDDWFFAGANASPNLPTDSSGLPVGFFSGASASPIQTSIAPIMPVGAPNLQNDLTFAPPTISVPVLSATTPTALATTNPQAQQAAAITSLASVANAGIKAATQPSAAALTAQQAAIAAAQNPLNQVVPGLNMTVGTLLLMGGVLLGGAVLISKLK